jgi:hypothetical protein
VTLFIQVLLEHKNVLDFYHCSAYHSKDPDLTDALTAFQAAELAVQCPLHSIFDVNGGWFTPQAKIAFERVFRCFSDAGDNMLSHAQLSALQESCYNSDGLNDEEFESLKEQVTTLSSTLIFKIQ